MMNYTGKRVLGLVFLPVFLAVGDVAFGVSVNFRPVMAQATKQSQQADRQAIRALINQQIKGTNEENLEGVMITIHPNSPQYAMTQRLIEQIFILCDQRMQLNKIDFLKITTKESKIRVSTSSKVAKSSPQCRSNNTVMNYTLQKDRGMWKVYLGEIQKLEYLN